MGPLSLGPVTVWKGESGGRRGRDGDIGTYSFALQSCMAAASTARAGAGPGQPGGAPDRGQGAVTECCSCSTDGHRLKVKYTWSQFIDSFHVTLDLEPVLPPAFRQGKQNEGDHPPQAPARPVLPGPARPVLSQYIIEVLGCIAKCIKMYSQMYWEVFGEVFGFMNRMGIHINTSGNTSQYIVKYIIIPLKYISIHL
jgi:hypothetical protein